jgi:hypothetical protein
MQSILENPGIEIAEETQHRAIAGPSRVVVTFEAAGASSPLAVRLRRLLKSALRSSGLRAVDVKELP